MEQRTLGHTGVSVSSLCLGAMMFGAWGEPDHDAGIAIIHRALVAGGAEYVRRAVLPFLPDRLRFIPGARAA